MCIIYHVCAASCHLKPLRSLSAGYCLSPGGQPVCPAEQRRCRVQSSSNAGGENKAAGPGVRLGTSEEAAPGGQGASPGGKGASTGGCQGDGQLHQGLALLLCKSKLLACVRISVCMRVRVCVPAYVCVCACVCACVQTCACPRGCVHPRAKISWRHPT